MTKEDGFQHFGLRYLAGSGFHHHNGVTGTGNGKIQPAFLSLVIVWIDNIFSIHHPYGNGPRWSGKWNVGYTQGNRGTDHCKNLRRIFRINGQCRRNNHHIIPESLRKQGPDRSVNQPGSQNGFFGWPAFPFDKPAWNSAYCIHLFFKIHTEREKIDIIPGGVRCRDCDQNHGITVSYHTCSVGLLGHFSDFHR